MYDARTYACAFDDETNLKITQVLFCRLFLKFKNSFVNVNKYKFI